jgi:drug/metabolite transporter (DMT)-like permease
MPAQDIALAVLVQLIWGVGFTSMKPFVAAFPPLLFIAMVYAIIALVCDPAGAAQHHAIPLDDADRRARRQRAELPAGARP